MKKVMIWLGFLIFAFVNPLCYAGGVLTHMFIAQNVISMLPNAELRNLLLNNFDAYLIGAYYPDSGYVQGAHYGEDSHWDLFIDTFADYLKEKYSYPHLQNPKLVAFLFGCATHRVSDEIMHSTFYNITKDKDFKGNYELAHHYGDFGIDILIDVEKKQSLSVPQKWWIPVKDLLEVYHRMQKDNYTANEIIWGNSVMYAASNTEGAFSALFYPFMKWKMPWTASHYYDWPDGGIEMDESHVIAYEMDLWNRITTHSTKNNVIKQQNFHETIDQSNSTIMTFAESLIENGIMSVDATTDSEGNVELQPPVVNQLEKLNAAIKKLLTDL